MWVVLPSLTTVAPNVGQCHKKAEKSGTPHPATSLERFTESCFESALRLKERGKR